MQDNHQLKTLLIPHTEKGIFCMFWRAVSKAQFKIRKWIIVVWKLEAKNLLHHLPAIALWSSTWLVWSGGMRSHTQCSLQHIYTAVPWLQPHVPGESARDHTSFMPLFTMLSHTSLTEHIPRPNHILLIHFLLFPIPLIYKSFWCASNIVLVL